MNLFMMVKSMFKHFSFINFTQDFMMEKKIVAWTMIDVFNKITREEKGNTEKDS